MKIEIVAHPADIIEVDEAILETMKRRLAEPKPAPQPTSIFDRD